MPDTDQNATPEQPNGSEPVERRKFASIGVGVAIGLALPVALVLVGLLPLVIGLASFAFPIATVGVFQLAWILPLMRHFRGTGRPETAKGLIIAASIVFLLNAGCWGFVVTALVSR